MKVISALFISKEGQESANERVCLNSEYKLVTTRLRHPSNEELRTETDNGQVLAKVLNLCHHSVFLFPALSDSSE